MINALYANVASENWNDWHWQLQNSCRSLDDLVEVFPSLPATQDRYATLQAHTERFKFLVTPYTLSNIELDSHGNPMSTDPLWRQIHCESVNYTSVNEIECSWEKDGEVSHSVLHQKYPGRALIRISNTCFGYCIYCYCAHRTIERKCFVKEQNPLSMWPSIIDYLKKHDDIHEVLLSGGDPLMLPNDMIAKILSDLRSVPSLKFIRINTRALTFCPSRIDRELAQLFSEYRLNALEVHFCNIRELTNDVDNALSILRSFTNQTLFLSRAPLLRGVNDSLEQLESLFLELYKKGIYPYYLFHFSPDGMARSDLGVPLQKGTELLRALRRKIPGPAFPRYTLFHPSGKHDIPLDAHGTNEFVYTKKESGEPMVSFVNWRGEWVTYNDVAFTEAPV